MQPSLYQPSPDLAAFIARLPKTETHLHLEGSVPWELLQGLDPVRFAEHPPFWAADYRYPSFEHFLAEILNYGAPWYNSPENYARAAAIVLRNCAAQNAKYVETSIHLPVVNAIGVPGPELIAAIRAAAPPDLELRIFLGMCRDDYERLPGQIEAAIAWEGLDGIDLHGVETIPLQPWTAGVWKRARENGKFTKAHAGEFGPASFVREAVEVLGVNRVEHGVRAAEDPEVVALLRDRGVTLDICPVSNVKLRVASSIAAHPIGALHRAGVRCTINSDDPFFFGTTLNNEYAALAMEGGFSRRDLALLARNGFEIALLPEAKKQKWIAEIDAIIAGL